MGSGRGDKAVRLLEDAARERPDDPELRSAERVILSWGIPKWHLAMLADTRRNDAFGRAICRAVSPGATVLDIGTGSGLMAMLAARAGAGAVIACESKPALAETARAIVAANGWADTVRVIGKASTQLDRGADLMGGADVIIAEVFADDVIGEAALPTLAHALSALARPTVQMIPAEASIRIALADWPREPQSLRDVNGFDLSLFERHSPAWRRIRSTDARLQLRSDPANLFNFVFAPGQSFPPGRSSVTLKCLGPANGFVQWVRLRLDAQEEYENAPGSPGQSHWSPLFHSLPGGRRIAEGEDVVIEASHDGERLQVWLA
jgi:type II protein arginine methyltransferase